MRVRITRGMFKDQTGNVVDEGVNGVRVEHTLPPILHDDPKRAKSREGETLRSWFSWASLEKV